MIPEHVLVGSKQFGREFATAMMRMHAGDQAGGVDMAVIAIRMGEYRRADVRALPAHLPPDDAGQRVLVLSKVPADLPLRKDLEDWARENRELAERCAAGIRTLVCAWRAALKLQDTEAAEYIANHLRFEHGVLAEDAPAGWLEMDAWCRSAVLERVGDAVPEWLYKRQSRRAFVPRTNEPRRLDHVGDEPVAAHQEDVGDRDE